MERNKKRSFDRTKNTRWKKMTKMQQKNLTERSKKPSFDRTKNTRWKKKNKINKKTKRRETKNEFLTGPKILVDKK